MFIPDPIAFTIFGFEVHWYGILIAAAFILCFFLAKRRMAKAGMDSDLLYDFFIFLIPSIVVGARLYYVIFEWNYFAAHPEEIIAVWHGGLAIHGGIIAGIIVAIIFCKVKKLDFYQFADVVIPVLPLGQAIGRWGNFFNSEAHGVETTLPWAITVYDSVKGYIQVHPTFLYESIWDLLVFIFLIYMGKKHKKFDGELLFMYLIAYSVGRFFIEGLRTDSLMILGLRTAQLISIACIIIGIIGLIYIRKRKTKLEK